MKSKKRKKKKSEGSLEDFVESVSSTMEAQALEHPELRHVHAKLSPEWREVSAIAFKAIEATDDKTAARFIEALIAHGSISIRVVVDIIRSLHKAARPEVS